MNNLILVPFRIQPSSSFIMKINNHIFTTRRSIYHLILTSIVIIFCLGLQRFQLPCQQEARDATAHAKIMLRNAGYQVRSFFTEGSLRQGESSVFRRMFYRGEEYALFLAGCPHTSDLDLHVYDDSGRLVVEDSINDSKAIVKFVAPYTGQYFIKIVNYKSLGPMTNWTLQYGYR